jgi:RNA polymerase sigma-70 factor (ECF subfamily)
VLRRFGVRAADLPDACQDVFLVVHRRLCEFEGRAAHRTWLYRICVCVASDYRKRAHRRYERFGEREPQAGPAAAADDRAITAQLARRIGAALDRLEDDKRRVFLLYELEELSMVEVAARLRCPLKTAFSRLYAARRELRLELRRAGIAGAFGWFWLLRPLRAQAASLAGLGVAHAGAVSCALTLVTLQVIGVESWHAKTGPMLVMEASAETMRETPSSPVRWPPIEAHVRTPQRNPPISRPDSKPRQRRAHESMAVEHATQTPRPHAEAAGRAEAPAQWIHAPTPAPSTAAREPVPASIGLDEVMAATSIKPLMRFGPGGASSAQPFTLVTSRTRTR